MLVTDKFGDPVTERRWKKVDKCITTFIKVYPDHWRVFKQDLNENRTKFQEALTADGKRAQWRNTAAFPVVYRRATLVDMESFTGEEEDDLVEVASLIEPLKVFLPGLLDPDVKGKPNKLYREFLRRYPIFLPGEHY